MLSGLHYRIRTLFRRSVAEEDLDEELRFHFESAVERLMATGLTETEARRNARLSFGGIEQVKEECRDSRGISGVETTMQDILYALRSLRRNQAMTVIAVMTLALGIGSSTLVFSIVEAALLRPLPFRDPARLVQVSETRIERGITQSSFTEANFWDVRSQSRSFQEMAASSYYEANLTGAGPRRK